MDVLEQLDRQQQLGEVVAQGRNDPQVRFRQPARDLLDRGRLRGDPHALRRQLGRGGGKRARRLGVGAVDVERRRAGCARAAAPPPAPGSRPRSDRRGRRGRRRAARPRSGGACGARRSPKTRSSGVFMTIWVRPAAMPRSRSRSRASAVTKMWPSANAALSRSSARISRTERMLRRAVEEGREQLREGVVEVEHDRRAAQLRQQRREARGRRACCGSRSGRRAGAGRAR